MGNQGSSKGALGVFDFVGERVNMYFFCSGFQVTGLQCPPLCLQAGIVLLN